MMESKWCDGERRSGQGIWSNAILRPVFHMQFTCEFWKSRDGKLRWRVNYARQFWLSSQLNSGA